MGNEHDLDPLIHLHELIEHFPPLAVHDGHAGDTEPARRVHHLAVERDEIEGRIFIFVVAFRCGSGGGKCVARMQVGVFGFVEDVWPTRTAFALGCEP